MQCIGSAFCPRGCCIATYCPLVLAWATTIHKFQGFEAGFDESDDINYIIANINNLAWEKLHPGTAYTVTSRAKTIGTKTPDTPHPLDSNLFFEGQVGSQRFTNIAEKVNGEKCELLVKRENWVDYLHEREAASKLCRMNSEKNIQEILSRTISLSKYFIRQNRSRNENSNSIKESRLSSRHSTQMLKLESLDH